MHTEITPQVTQVQPEVTVRKVIHDVPVAQPVAIQTPVQYVAAAGPVPVQYSGAVQYAAPGQVVQYAAHGIPAHTTTVIHK